MDESAIVEQPAHQAEQPAGRELLRTGNRAVDEVLSRCAELDRLGIAERLARLDAAELALAHILDSSRDGGVATLPGVTSPVDRAS